MFSCLTLSFALLAPVLAGGEDSLDETLRDVFLRGESSPPATGLLGAILRGEALGSADDIPADAREIRVAAQRIPLPTPTALAHQLAAAIDSRAARSCALVALIGKAPPPTARELLRTFVWDPPPLLPVSARAGAILALGAVGNLEDALRLERLASDGATELRGFAANASFAIVQRARTGDRSEELERYFSARRPSRVAPAPQTLELAALHLRAGEIEPATKLLESVRAHVAGGSVTADLELHAEASLGLALCDWLDGRVERAFAHLDQGAEFPRSPFAREDGVAIRLCRLEIARGCLLAWGQGESPAQVFERATLAAPLSDERSLFDLAWNQTPFGLDLCEAVLRQSGRANEITPVLRELLAAVERTRAQTGLGLLGRDRNEEERPVSWLFLRVADSELRDSGDPEAALALLQPRMRNLEPMLRWDHHELLAHTRLLESRAYLLAGDASGAHTAATRALDVARALDRSAREDWLRSIDRGDLRPPPVMSLLGWSSPPYSALLQRALAVRSNLSAVLDDDPEAAAEALWETSLAPTWDSTRWASAALDFARRGQRDWAERARECIEHVDHQLYNGACLAASLGRPAKAIELLERHLARHSASASGRALEVHYMRRDPDLRTLRDDPRFPAPEGPR